MELLQKLQTNQEDGTVSRLRAAWPFWCFLLLVLLSLVFILTDIFPQRDVACRYAPMADAFRDRDFTYAFHPRTGFLPSWKISESTDSSRSVEAISERAV